MVEFPIYEGLLGLYEFFQKFEKKVFELQRILALDVAQKDTLNPLVGDAQTDDPRLGAVAEIDDGPFW